MAGRPADQCRHGEQQHRHCRGDRNEPIGFMEA
jgi:hypothetical protein